VEIDRQKELALEFTRGTHGNIEKPAKLAVPSPNAPLGDIRTNRDAGSPHLSGDAELLAPGELSRQFINALCQNTRGVPDSQVPKILHSLSKPSSLENLEADS
jgi:hypothetical protein